MSDELKACPKCGGNDIRISEGEIGATIVYCMGGEYGDCGCKVFAVQRHDAIFRWNTRPVEDALRKELEEAKKLLTDCLLKRYGLGRDEDDGYEVGIIADDQGDYVKHSEAAALLAEKDAEIERLRGLFASALKTAHYRGGGFCIGDFDTCTSCQTWLKQALAQTAGYNAKEVEDEVDWIFKNKDIVAGNLAAFRGYKEAQTAETNECSGCVRENVYSDICRICQAHHINRYETKPAQGGKEGGEK